MFLHRAVEVHASPADVFELVSDVERYPEFFHGMTRWEAVGDQLRGEGARYRVLMQVGSIEAGGIVRVEEWEEPRIIAWAWERGVHHDGAWRLEAHGDRTLLSLELDYRLAGAARWLAERLAARVVSRNIEATLQGARRIIQEESAG